MRTGQLVVRYQSSWRRRALLVAAALGAVLLLYILYEWGRFEGGYSKFAETQRRRELTARIESVEQENERLRAEIRRCREMPDRPFGINLTFLPTLRPPDYPALIRVCVEERIRFIETAGRNPEPYMPQI